MVSAQTLSGISLAGKYFVRQVEFTTDVNNNATDARSIVGTMTFDGQGSYSFTGQQAVGTGAAAAFTASGTYSVDAAGIVALTNPQKPALTLQARFGGEALIGSSTEAPDNTFDMFAAIPAPASGAAYSNSNLSVSYNVGDFELTNASTAQVRDAGIVGMQFDGHGNIQSFSAQGHGASIAGGATQKQKSWTGTYSVNADGSGTLAFQLPSGMSAGSALLGAAARTLAVSATGNTFLAGTPGGHDILIGLRDAATDNITPANFTGRFWVSGIQVSSSGSSPGGSSQSYVGAGTVITPDSAVILSERLHKSSSPSHIYTTTSANYSAAPSGKGGAAILGIGSTFLLLGNNGTLIAAALGQDSISGQPSGQDTFAVVFGEAIPSLTGPGVFVNPQGVVNAASNAPVGNPISPGEFIAIYGSGLASQTLVAPPPYPSSLGGVTVSIGGFPAPIYLVSAGQINCLVPWAVNAANGPATIVVTNGVASNSVTVPVSPTSPGIFSRDLTGTGDGAITHADNTFVNAGSPAVAGETLVVYLTGLGALQSPLPDGQAPNPAGPDLSVAQVQVMVDGIPSPNVAYAGINPVYPGLYQIDFQMPPIPDHGEVPILILTPDAGTEEISLFVQ